MHEVRREISDKTYLEAMNDVQINAINMRIDIFVYGMPGTKCQHYE